MCRVVKPALGRGASRRPADVEDDAVRARVPNAERKRERAAPARGTSSTGWAKFIEKVARPPAKLRIWTSEAASIDEAASSNEVSWAKSRSGPTSTSTEPE